MSPITPKTNLTTPMLPLHAIPTEVIRKGFRPYRGFMTSLLVNLPQDDQALRHHIGRPLSALSAEKAAELALDVTPIYDVFARLFGYDPALLKVGNGECGVEGHDWNLYGEKNRVPQVVRWRGFDGGEALLCIGTDQLTRYAQVVGLADEIMAPKMYQAFEAIGEMREKKGPASIDRPVGDLLEKVMLDVDLNRFDFSASVWHELHEGKPTERQAEDLQKLRFSCRTYRGQPRGHLVKLTQGTIGKLRRSRLPGQRIALIGRESDFPIVLQPDEPTPQHFSEQIYAQSVKDVEGMMQNMLGRVFETQVERVHDFLDAEELSVTAGDPEENERVFALGYFIGRAEAGLITSMNDLVLKTTFSREFRGTPAKSLLGTHSVKKLYGGHVLPGADLIEMAITSVMHEADFAIGGLKDHFALLGRVVTSDDLALQRDKEAVIMKAYKLAKPYTAVYRGLPIRVIDSYVVSHGDDSEGLACDYHVDHQNQALHFVSLYRVKANKP